MGSQADTSPELAAAAGFMVVSAALEHARKDKPHLVEWLEEAQITAAKRLVAFNE